ncbi:hypothetical protein KUTeg_023325 [Tegillarca granosa]|uniref:Condensin complex subunit 1 C-terminal domain-containing protein n=1 Tax=Tegillarca granosa TaxID=220873 RepID=A0ABQ9E6W8_TEGGR|nr:hypothetical protein KUTeg_023325 [Tegillarca granosa]
MKMANSRKSLDAFVKLELQNLEKEWVKGIWDSDFTDIDMLDIATENDIQNNNYHTQTLKLLLRVLENWITDKEGQNGEGLWTVLVENDISHKSFIALLAFLIDNGTKKTSSLVQKEAAVLSCSNYLKLLTVPGSGAFKVFHPVLYEKCVDVLKLWNNIGVGKRKRSISPGQNKSKRKKSTSPSPGRGQRNRQSRDKNSQRNNSDLVQDFYGSDEEEDSVEELAPQEMSSLKKLLKALLQDLVCMLEAVSLRQSEASADHTVQRLAYLSRQETEDFDGKFDKQNLPLTRMSVPELAYKVSEFYLSNNDIYLKLYKMDWHTYVDHYMVIVGFVVHSTFKNLLPNLLMLSGDNNKGVAANTIPRYLCLAKDQAVSFVCYLLKVCGDRALDSVRTLIQHLCTKVPDRAEYRHKVTQAVVTILNELPVPTYCKMVEWFFKLSKHKINNRAFAVDLVSSLLALPEKEINGTDVEEDLVLLTKHQSLLGILLARCSDIAPTVRSRALAAFSQCFTSHEVGIKNTLKDIVTPRIGPRVGGPPHLIPTPVVENRAQGLCTNDSQTVSDKTADNDETPGVTDETPARGLPGVNYQTPFLQIALTPYNPELSDDGGILSMFRRRAKDEKVIVRKSALQAIEQAIRFEAPDYRRQDIEVLVERCRDPALSVRKQAMQCLTDLMLEMPTEKTLQESVSSSHKLAWDLLGIISKFESVDLRRYLQKSCRYWARQGKIKPSLITALETHIYSNKNEETWMLIAELAPAVPKLSHGFVLDYWEKEANNSDGKFTFHNLLNLFCRVESHFQTLQRVLTVIRCIAKHIPDEKRNSLIDALKERLKKFDSPPELIAITISTLSKLYEAQAEKSSKRIDRESWCVDLLHASDKYLSHVILDEKGGIDDEDKVVRHLFTLGEIAQLCPAKTPKRVFLIVQSMIAAPCITSVPSSQGKLCLQNEDLAKKCVAALARELETSPDPTIRNNVVIIMCDLCVRYTTTADRYVSNIAACLKDESQLVRKQTLTLLTRLLQEDFLKWKGTLFFRFISTLLDDNKEITDFAEFCLVHLLFQRHPDMFFHHFMECIFHFNAYEGHSSNKRLKLYLFMLDNMTDEHRFHLTAKICQVILGGVVDGIIPLNTESSALLQDSLHILSSKEIKLTSLRVKQNEDVVADEQEMAAVVIAAAKKNIITQVVKKNVIENIVPIVMSLKHMLEKHRSPVLKDLMYYLRELMKDYKTEVKDILAADRQLASEIEFDLRKFEEQQEEAMKRKSTAQSMQNSPTIQSIQPSPAVGSTKGTPATGTSSPSNQPKSPSTNKDTPLHGSRVPQPVIRNPGSVELSTRSPLGSSSGSRQQHRTQSPLKNPPVMSLLNEHRATPRREAPLSTIALLNSAKKLISKVQQMDASKLNSPSGKTPENNRRKSCFSKGDKADNDNESSPAGFAVDEETSEENTPLRPNTRSTRAISTPSGVLGNITFHMDQNVTLIPPSPIPTSLPIRVYADMSDEAESPVTPRKRNNKQTEKEVVYMFSPDKPSPKPRKWNVKSAPPTRSVRGKDIENIDSDGEESKFLSLSEQGNENSNISKKDTRKTAVPDKNQDKPVVRRSSGRRNVKSRRK